MELGEIRGIRHEGKQALYQTMLAPLAGGSTSAAALRDLEALTLAAGDFRVVRDRYALEGRASHQELVSALAEEARVRRQHEGGRVAGFMAS